MKKIFTLLSMFLIAIGAWATTVDVVIKDYAEANSWANDKKYTSIEMDDVITASVTGGGNSGKYYTSGYEWRLYQTESPKLTFTAKSGYVLNSITVTYTVKNSGVLLDGTNQVVSETAVSVSGESHEFSVGNTGTATNGQVKITKISVTYTTASGTVAPTFSIKSGMYFETQNVELSTTTEGADIFYTTNGDDPTASSTKYTAPISVSATTTIKAIAIKGSDASSVVSATYTIVQTTGKGTAESPFSIADALSVINVLGDGKSTSDDVYTKGIVVGDVTVNASGQAQFTIGATASATDNLITVYRAKGLENEAYVAGDTKAGDEVVICAPLQKFVKDNVTTPETQYGYIYSINGETSKAAPVLAGDGSETNPFTANDLIIMKTSQRPTGAVWVKGIIRGTYKSKTELDTDGASNIAIATSAEATEFAPVELKNETEFRSKLNVKDNAGNKGKEVLLKGTITDYFSPATGVKNLVEAKLDGQVITGINELKAAGAQFEGKMYNLAGQVVNKAYKGMVIMNGRKFVNK